MKMLLKAYVLMFIGPLFGAAVGFTMTANAAELNIAVGVKDGTYWQMFQQANEMCQTPDLTINPIETKGCTENADKIISNRVNGGLCQLDILALEGQTRNLTSIKQLFTLYPEEIHIIVTSAPRSEGGLNLKWWKPGSKEVVFNTIEDLKGRRVGALGGSIRTAEIIRELSRIDFELIDLGAFAKSGADQVESLMSGRIDAILAVGGQPLGWVDNLDRRFKILTIPNSVASKMKNVYRSTTLNYSKMGVRGVETISTDAVFFVRDYRSKAIVSALGDYRSCVLNNLNELREKAGNHPKWQDVRDDQMTKPENRANWPWLELPAGNAKPVSAEIIQKPRK